MMHVSACISCSWSSKAGVAGHSMVAAAGTAADTGSSIILNSDHL